MNLKTQLKGSLIFFSLVLVLMASVGCNQEPITNVYITEETDTFTMSGRILSYPQGTPVTGANYKILSGNLTGTSDENGFFEVKNLSPGIYQVALSAEGYTSTRATMTLVAPSDKSNINAHRDFYVLENLSDLELTVRGQDTGEVLSGVTVGLSSVELPISGHMVDMESLPTGVQTDENGQATLTGLPAVRVWIAALAHDADGDDEPDYGTQLNEFHLKAGEPNTGHMVMPQYTGDTPNLIATNLPAGYSGIPIIAPSFYFIFSVPMKTSGGTEVSLRQQNNPYMDIPLTATWTSPIRLEVTPSEALSNANMYYDFNLTAYSEDGLPFSTYRNTIFWITGDDPVSGDCDEVVTDLIAENSSGGEIDFDTRSTMLTWSAVSCSGGYRIYARDDRNNIQWVFLQEEPTDYETGTVTAICSLPASFDRYEVDSIQTPYAGTEVTFCVVPKRATVSPPGDPHGTVVVGDAQAPSITRVTQFGDGINNFEGTESLVFGVVFSEYIDPSVADPVFEVAEIGGDPAFTLDPANGTWVWNAGRFSGRFVFELPAGTNASEDHYRVTINDLTDLSGNTVAGSSSTAWQVIELWGGIFDFESSPQGWTQTGQGWAWGTPTIGPVGAHDGMRCWGVTLDANYGNNWDTDLMSQEIFVPGVNPYLSYWCWYSTDYYDDYVRVYVSNGTNEEILESFTGTSSGWVLKTYNLSQFAGQKITIRLNFSSDSYDTYAGFFLDDVTVDTQGD